LARRSSSRFWRFHCSPAGPKQIEQSEKSRFFDAGAQKGTQRIGDNNLGTRHQYATSYGPATTGGQAVTFVTLSEGEVKKVVLTR